MQNLPHAGGESHPLGWGTWAARGSRGCCIPPKTFGDPWALQNQLSGLMLLLLCSSILHIKTQPPPFPEGKEILERDWGQPEHHYWVDPVLCGGKQKGTWLVEGILVYSPLPGWVLHQCPNQRTSPMASCGLQVSICPTGKEWLVECSALLRCIKDYLLPKEFQGVRDYQVVWQEEKVMWAMALQRCAVWSGIPQGCYAEQYRSSAGALPLWWNRAIC